MRMPGELRFTLPSGEQTFLLDAPTTTIGRGPKNSVSLPDQSVSRFHAELIRLGKDYLLRDLGSANGSFVNGVPVSEQLLNDGDVLRFGTSGIEVIFKLSVDNSADAHERHITNTTDSLIASLSTLFDPASADQGEEVSRCCVLAEAYLSKGEHEKAFAVLSKYARLEDLLQVPARSRGPVLYWLGRTYLDGKQYPLAQRALATARDEYMQAGDDVGVARARAELARTLMGLGDWPVARDNFHRALLTARRAGNARLQAKIHLSLGKLDWKEGDFDGARYQWSRAARLSEGGQDALLQANVQLQQGFILLAEGKLKEAVTVYQAAVEIVEKLGNIRFLLKAYSHLSRALTRHGSWAATERLLEYRLRLARENSLAKAEAVALTDLAELRYFQGAMQAAWNMVQAAVRRHGTTYARTQRILGRILVARREYDSAIAEYDKGLAAAAKKGALEEQVLIGLELALAYLESGDKEKASEQLKSVESDPLLDPGLGLMARALYARALIDLAFDETVEANRKLTQCLAIFQSVDDPYRQAVCHAAIGKLRAEAGRLDSARGHLEAAKDLFAKLGARIDLERTNLLLASIMHEAIVPAMTQVLSPGLTMAAPLSMSISLTTRLATGGLDQKPQRILIAQADDNLASLLENGLVAENYVIDRVLDGGQALERAVSPDYAYDMLILDTLLEHRSGFDVCRDLRKANLDVPLILLGNRQGTEDKIEALQAGAHDFISKRGMVFEELLAKVQSLLS